MIIPRYRRLGVKQRMNYLGEIVTELDEEDARRVVRELRSNGVESIAVCLLFSYINDAHERRLRELINDVFPEAYVSISSEVIRQVREYERTSTTVVNAYVGPILSQYLESLRAALAEEMAASVAAELGHPLGALARFVSNTGEPKYSSYVALREAYRYLHGRDGSQLSNVRTRRV